HPELREGRPLRSRPAERRKSLGQGGTRIGRHTSPVPGGGRAETREGLREPAEGGSAPEMHAGNNVQVRRRSRAGVVTGRASLRAGTGASPGGPRFPP